MIVYRYRHALQHVIYVAIELTTNASRISTVTPAVILISLHGLQINAYTAASYSLWQQFNSYSSPVT